MKLFNGIAGYEQEKEEFKELVDIINNRDKYRELGVLIPNGLLISGTPGNGKSMFAKSIIDSTNTKVYNIGPNEVFGDVATMIQDTFKEARESKNNAIVLIDELDTLTVEHSGPFESPSNKVISQLLIELDKNNNTDVFTIVISNRSFDINPALLRSGRIDIKIDLTKPNDENRKKLLTYYLNEHVYGESDIPNLVLSTKGLSCSDIKNVVSKAKLFSIRRDADSIERKDFEEAISRVHFKGLGRENKLSDENLKRIAIHECGHAIVTYKLMKKDFNLVTVLN